jgi:hypothetical protein
VEPPSISVGTAREYAYWESRLRKFLTEFRGRESVLERVDARYNYRENRITLYRLATPTDDLSVAETISHEMIHALLFQMGEQFAARAIDLVGKPVGNVSRTGGI